MDPTSDEFVETLRLAQRLGFLGDAPIEAVIAQGDLFASGLDRLGAGGRVVDLGSGGGSPGLIAACRRPDLEFTLVDRRQKRTDFLMRAVRRLELANVEVVCDDVVRLGAAVTAGTLGPFDGLTARGFGPFPLLLRMIGDLVVAGGLAVISDPPASSRWSSASLGDAPLRLIDRRGIEGRFDGGVAVLRRSTER